MSHDTAAAYQRSGTQLDDHLRTCPTCSVGVACSAGDDLAEAEYKAGRAWLRADPDRARAAQREGR